MSGFFGKLFGGKKKSASGGPALGGDISVQNLIEEVMAGLLEKADLDLDFEVVLAAPTTGDQGAEKAPERAAEYNVELFGGDENLLTEKEGALLDAFQLFVKRMLQHQMPDERVNVNFDCNGFRADSSRALVELADRLKEKALDQGRSVYVRALPPKDRKVVHQHLANDDRVKSRSVGDGLYKKIKIYPVKAADQSSRDGDDAADDSGDDAQA